ncbi:protein p13 MTCP-1, partial [Lepidochelys kempii]|uniref:protein p13 MTCP-1 n=1 Tax=Lepidochelys kempii TaxID=8472 RepID=UPI003C6F1754
LRFRRFEPGTVGCGGQSPRAGAACTGRWVSEPPGAQEIVPESLLLNDFSTDFLEVPIHYSEAGTLRARIQRVRVPLGEALRPSQLPPSQLPHMWQLSEGEQYRDSNSRIWEIQHHLMIRGVEELLLRLMPGD